MSTATPSTSPDQELIRRTMQMYVAGALSGSVDDLRPAFHADAVIHGCVGPDLFGGPIQLFYDWHAENGPAADLKTEIVHMDVERTVATVRMELDNWTGHRFTDMFTLLKVDNEWKITSKVFHMHA